MILNCAKTFSLKSLALVLLGVEEEYEIAMIAFIESIKDFIKSANSIEQIYVSSLDKHLLMDLEKYLKYGYDMSVLIGNPNALKPIDPPKKVLKIEDSKKQMLSLEMKINIQV